MPDDLERAAELLGSLEGRIMRLVWTGHVPAPFRVRDVHALLPELAYTTVMTTLRRLADKGLLTAQAMPGPKGHEYTVTGQPADFLLTAGARAAEDVVAQFGDGALAAFAAQLDKLSPSQRAVLDRLRRR